MLIKFSLALCAIALLCIHTTAAEQESERDRALHLIADGNYSEAESILRTLALDPNASPKDAAINLSAALSLLERLGRQNETPPLLEKILAIHPKNWRILSLAADAQPETSRRTRALNLLLTAEHNLDNPNDPATPEEKLAFYTQFDNTLRANRTNDRAWRLTALTDLTTPEPEDDPPYWTIPARGAPVDENGDPVYYRTPAGPGAGGWRWILARMELIDAKGKTTADWLLGQFLSTQFGVQTMTEWENARDAELAGEDGPFAVRTLKDSETIARLGGGLKRFAMPDEFNHILILRRVAEAEDAALREQALVLLAGIFENRQQYAKAVEIWRRLLRAESPGGAFTKTAAEAIERITANNGALEPGVSKPAGERSTLSYLFRNGEGVRFTATRLDEKKLLADIRDQLRAGDTDFFENSLYHNPEMLARIVFEKAGARYAGEVAARWEMDLEPLPDHFSRRVDVEVPVEAAGCYLVEAAMRDGNVSRVVLWIADLALVKKDGFDEQMLFVADAKSGEPVAGANVSFLSLNWRWDKGRRSYDMREFAGKTDADGLLFIPSAGIRNLESLITATTEDGGFAYIGFQPVWAPLRQPEDAAGQEAAFLITDRPVYRPGQEVRFKAWIGSPPYHQNF